MVCQVYKTVQFSQFSGNEIPRITIDGRKARHAAALMKNYSEFSGEERLMHDEIKRNLGETGKHFQAVTQSEVDDIFKVSGPIILTY